MVMQLKSYILRQRQEFKIFKECKKVPSLGNPAPLISLPYQLSFVGPFVPEKKKTIKEGVVIGSVFLFYQFENVKSLK